MKASIDKMLPLLSYLALATQGPRWQVSNGEKVLVWQGEGVHPDRLPWDNMWLGEGDHFTPSGEDESTSLHVVGGKTVGKLNLIPVLQSWFKDPAKWALPSQLESLKSRSIYAKLEQVFPLKPNVCVAVVSIMRGLDGARIDTLEDQILARIRTDNMQVEWVARLGIGGASFGRTKQAAYILTANSIHILQPDGSIGKGIAEAPLPGMSTLGVAGDRYWVAFKPEFSADRPFPIWAFDFVQRKWHKVMSEAYNGQTILTSASGDYVSVGSIAYRLSDNRKISLPDTPVALMHDAAILPTTIKQRQDPTHATIEEALEVYSLSKRRVVSVLPSSRM